MFKTIGPKTFKTFSFLFITATGGPGLGLPGSPTTKLERVLGMPTLFRFLGYRLFSFRRLQLPGRRSQGPGRQRRRRLTCLTATLRGMQQNHRHLPELINAISQTIFIGKQWTRHALEKKPSCFQNFLFGLRTKNLFLDIKKCRNSVKPSFSLFYRHPKPGTALLNYAISYKRIDIYCQYKPIREHFLTVTQRFLRHSPLLQYEDEILGIISRCTLYNGH